MKELDASTQAPTKKSAASANKNFSDDDAILVDNPTSGEGAKKKKSKK